MSVLPLPEMNRKHNKSGLTTLGVLEYSDSQIAAFHQRLTQQLHSKPGLIRDSPCRLMNCRDGKLSSQQQKITWGYHIQAFIEFGREALLKVPPNKSNTSLTISHLCGTALCCAPNHTILETKEINDERTCCQFIMLQILQSNDYDYEKLDDFRSLKGCKHEPQCGHLR
jgi:hypothetical protein